MTMTTHGAAAPAADTAAHSHYFTAWRWHFYAGLYAIPFLLMLALTGLTMLWISWFAGLGAERMAVTPGTGILAVSQLQAVAEAAVPGSAAVTYVAPLAADRVAVVSVALDGVQTGIALDPYTGAVLHQFPWRAGWYDLANRIHGTLLLGTFGDRLIEIAASLAVILVVSGLYLHWPRNGAGWRGLLLPRLAACGRAFWKSLHGVVGFWLSLFLLLFLVSGLSWSGIWGERLVQAWNTFPAEKYAPPSSGGAAPMADEIPMADETHAAMNHGGHDVPWTLEQAPMPASGSLAGTRAVEGPVDIDNVAAFAEGLGFIGRFQLSLPRGETGVWTISHDSMTNDGPNPAADRTLHLDRFSGNVLADIRYADYSPYAKAMAWGIAFHEGDLGLWNLILNTLVCASVALVAVSGAVMWWKRRPVGAGRLAAPPVARGGTVWWGGAALVLGLGAAFPMGGAAILAILVLDRLMLAFIPRLKRALS